VEKNGIALNRRNRKTSVGGKVFALNVIKENQTVGATFTKGKQKGWRSSGASDGNRGNAVVHIVCNRPFKGRKRAK